MNLIKFHKYYMHNMVIKCIYLLIIANKVTNNPCKLAINIIKYVFQYYLKSSRSEYSIFVYQQNMQ